MLPVGMSEGIGGRRRSARRIRAIEEAHRLLLTPEPRRELVDEPRLPDPCFALDEHHSPAPRLRLPKELAQLRELLLPAIECSRPRRVEAQRRTDRPERGRRRLRCRLRAAGGTRIE